MSIATQIQRLINAKKAIKSSIVNKSVTVADTVKLDGYGTLINQIGANTNIGPNDVIKGKMAFGNNGKYFNGTALSVQTSANNARILNGFTAYDSNGQLLTGNAMPTAATALNNRIMKGYTAYTNTGVLLNGTAFGNVTNATNSSLLKGHTAYLNNGVWLNGTAFGNTTSANNATILKGYTAYLNNGFYLNGTAFGNVTNATNAQILSGQRAYLNNGFYLSGSMTNHAGSSLSAGNTVMNNTAFALNSSVNAYISTSTQFYTTWDSFMDKAYTAESNGNINFYVGRIGYSTQTFSGMTDSADFECDGRPRGYILMQMSYVDDIWDATDQDKIIIGIQDAVWQDSPSTTTQNVVVAYGSTTSSYDDRVRIRTYEDVVDVTYHSDTQILSLVLNSEARSDVYFYGKYRFLYWY